MQHLAAVHLLWVVEAVADPEVHAKVEVAEPEHHGLVALGVVEGPPAELKALLDGSREQHDVLRVAMSSFVEQVDIALLGASRQSS